MGVRKQLLTDVCVLRGKLANLKSAIEETK